MAPTADGKTTYLAMEAGQFLALDTTSVVNAPSPPASVINLHADLLTNPVNRPVWEQAPLDPSAVPAECFRTCPNGHSAVPIPGTHYVLTTDEVYGTFTDPSFGCPWGWARIINVAEPRSSRYRERVQDQRGPAVVLRQLSRRPAHRAVHQLLLT